MYLLGVSEIVGILLLPPMVEAQKKEPSWGDDHPFRNKHLNAS